MLMHDSVLEFMEKHNQAVAKIPTTPPPDVRLLRVRLIAEETAELIVAMHKGDLVEVADAIADSLYVVVGTAIAFGQHNVQEPVFPQRTHGSFIPSEPTRLVIARNLHNAASYMIDNTSEGTYIIPPYRRMLGELIQTFALFDIPGEDIFREVHRSNMTKPKLDGFNKGGKVSKEGYEPPDLKPLLGLG